MSLIAGCYNFKSHCPSVDVYELTKRFQIDPMADNYDYVIDHHRSVKSQLVAKYIKSEPPQIQCFENERFYLLVLGFHEKFLNVSNKTSVFTDHLSDLLDGIKQGEGDYVAVVFDRVRHHMHIINNRFAQRLLYYFPTQDTFYFSTNITLLGLMLKGRLQIDPVGWLQIFNYSHTLGCRTNVNNMMRLFPATHITLSQAGAEYTPYWRLQHEPDCRLVPAEFARQVFDAFQKSCDLRAHLGPKKFIALSGGLDSRLVAGGMPADVDLHALTFVNSTEDQETPDVLAAREVARILDIPHHITTLSQTSVSDISDALMWLIGGLTPIHHAAKTWQFILESRRTGGYLIGGGPGDVLAGSYINSIYQIGVLNRHKHLANYFKKRCRFSRSLLRNIFCSEVLDAHWDPFEKSVQESYLSLPGRTPAHVITEWAMVYRQPAFTFTSAIHTLPDMMGISPHLGYEYSDLMLKLPASWLYNKNFYRYMIFQCLPELRDVIYANTGKPIEGVFHHYQACLLRKRLASPLWKLFFKVGLKSKPKKKISQNHFEYSLLRQDVKLLDQMKDVIHSVDKLKEIINVDACDLFIRRYREGELLSGRQGNDAELMGGLVTLCNWYKQWYG